jgi:2-oxoglutarate dehydrogenase E2 component (dihydrolipoamide succinyltransferase)
MSVSVKMPQLGESVTEGTVTRWLKKEGERVDRDEPLLEVSTDKVDTEIPSPAAGVLRGIVVGEEETVEVGAELAVIEDEDAAAGGAPADAGPSEAQAGGTQPAPPAAAAAEAPAAEAPTAEAQPAPAQSPAPPPPPPPPPPPAQPAAPAAEQAPAAAVQPPPPAPAPPAPAAPSGAYEPPAPALPEQPPPPPTQLPSGTESGTYVTPLVRKLAAEHGVDLGSVAGTGVGGRIRKQDVLEAARARRAAAQPPAPSAAQPAPAPQPAPAAQPPAAQPAAPAQQAPAAAPAAVSASPLRGTTEKLSRPRQLIAQRMVESLQVSAQLTTVVEVDMTTIARLRDRAKASFEAREGVKLSFLPFFARAALEALKAHPKLNAVIDTQTSQVTYHDAEHLGIAVDTQRGLMVPVIHKAGDLNIAGLARKIADIADRTRSGQVSPDELAGGTFTLTNTGSRGALFDTPIINQPQVAILGTGAVVKRPVVVEDPRLGEVMAVHSMAYLALTYDHRLIDGADAARFLATVKTRLEEGAFEAEFGL